MAQDAGKERSEATAIVPLNRAVRQLMRTLTLADQVRDYLLDGLTQGRLRPGDRINEAELARTLGISRNPIREAISGLAQRGFLISAPRRGHFMRGFTRKDVDDIFSFRICVETFAIRQALGRMREADHDDLSRILDDMIEMAEAGRYAAAQRADMALHRRICEFSGNRQTVRAHEGLDAELQMLMAFVDLEREPPSTAALMHAPIVEAMADRDVERAVEAMEAHLNYSWGFILKMYGEAGFDEAGHIVPPAARSAVRRSAPARAHEKIRP